MGRASVFGGSIADYPDAKRYYANGEPRPVKVSVTSFAGVVVGATHFYAVVREDDNPIWDGLHWRKCWDDKDGRGREYERRCDSERKAQRWARLIIALCFPGSKVEEMYENQFDWLPKAWIERLEGGGQ